MRNFKRKITIRSILESKPVLLGLGVLILVFAWSVFRFWNKMEETGRNKELIEERVIALREKKEKLAEDLESLSTDEGKEKFFRENYGFAKEGEQMIIVVEEKKPAAETEAGSFSPIIDFFKNLFR